MKEALREPSRKTTYFFFFLSKSRKVGGDFSTSVAGDILWAALIKSHSQTITSPIERLGRGLFQGLVIRSRMRPRQVEKRPCSEEGQAGRPME